MMQIQVKDIKSSRTTSLDVSATDTTEALKARLQETWAVPVEQQRLICRGKTLADGQALTQAGVQQGSTVHLVLRLQSSLTVHVRTMMGSTITFEVQPAATTGDAKRIVEQLVGLPAEDHTLNLNGCMAEAATMQAQGVAAGSTLRLVRRPMLRQDEDCAGRSEEQDRIRVYGALGSLYSRCGGIFGVAGFVDRCMDKWMADPTLNANEAVASWHERAQRCGFKFLVTQLMGYLAGGPQRYTGRSMADSHKHLNISPSEWHCFMDVFYEVCSEFGLPQGDVDDLAAVIRSMEADCVVQPGEEVPPPTHAAPPPSSTLYSRAGGAYPLALFVDRLVDALLSDKRVNIPVDGQKRNEASLKYLFTELVCSAAGGPEVMTSTAFPETRLLLPAKKMFFLLDAAKVSSDHFESPDLRIELITMLSMAEGLITDPTRSPPVPANLLERQQMVQELGVRAGVPIIYVPRGGVVVLDMGASPQQLDSVRDGLVELGLKKVGKSKVKTAADAASGSMLSAAVIAARYTSLGSFVAARKRVHGDPRTLYGRGGGVFGLAKLVDRLMDLWMADYQLNDNHMVARWHESQQRCGFKFLVTQIFGYLTGGPQRYTGQPMDVSHKHLNITAAQWDAFMAGAGRAFRDFNIDHATQRDLNGIIESFKDQIIIHDGEAVPADPGLCRRPPSGNTLYAHAGGAYPLAYFADALVNKALDPRGRVRIPHDPSFKRTAPGLKYLVTELVCSASGGPEVVTSRGFDDAKLGVPVEDWPHFLDMVAEAAAAQWPGSTMVQRGIQAMVEEQKSEICIGLVTDCEAATDLGRSMLMQAGYGLFEASAALDQCAGDAHRALELLTSGWTPPAPAADPAQGSGSGSCPFTGKNGRCPVAAMASAAMAAAPSSGSARARVPNTNTTSSSASGQQAGRALGDPMQAELDALLVEDAHLVCPITLTLLLDPVIASDGCVYERAAVAELARVQGVSPITQAPLTGLAVPATEQRAQVLAFMEARSEELFRFAQKCKKQGKTVMALTVLDRLKDYLAALAQQGEAEPPLVQLFIGLCRELGRVEPSLADPHERITRILKDQVARAKAEGETVLQERGTESGGGAKSVVFAVDTSGSMRGARLQKARENMMRIFDQYIEDEDHMSFVTFSHFVQEHIPLQEVGSGRSRMRATIEAACGRATGGTAFWDALAGLVIQNLRASPPGNQQWIVALTDGMDQHSQRHSMSSAKVAVRDAEGSPNLIVVGIQLEEHVKGDLQELCTATDSGLFIDASGDLSSLDDAFQQVAEMICD